MLVVFDIDDSMDLRTLVRYDMSIFGLCRKDIVEITVHGWTEQHCPIRYSPRLSPSDILNFVALDMVEQKADIADEQLEEYVTGLVEMIYPSVDRVLSRAINPLSLFRVEKIFWMGNSCHVKFSRGV